MGRWLTARASDSAWNASRSRCSMRTEWTFKGGRETSGSNFGPRGLPLESNAAMLSLFGLDPATYAHSALHDPDRTFRETNCYVDLWIELLHAQGIDAASAMAF